MNLIDGKHISVGTDYYPEHWSRDLWEEDLTRMLAAGIRTIRIAEFAWNKVEISEGVFDFSFFDDFLDLTDRCGMQVIFCTPTATPPAWLSEKYPEILNADKDGQLFRHGARHQYNYNSPVYRKFVARIVEQEAAHYASRRSIIGWQIDNELNCETPEFYSESDDKAFREWLRKRYGTLEALNEAWGTAFWNQTYTDWSEVHLLRKTIGYTRNPHQALDYSRFVSDSACAFAKFQSDILQKYLKPGDFITTQGLFGNVDWHRLTGESLDVMMYDSYPDFAYQYDTEFVSPLKDRGSVQNLAEVRSVSAPFGIMEQQSGPGGWTSRMLQPVPKPGQIMLWAMQSVAAGADYVGFFRWRTSTIGTEIYWHGILDYSGRDNRRLAEVTQFAKRCDMLTKAGAAGTMNAARLGILEDYDNGFDTNYDRWHALYAAESRDGLFKACEKTHTAFDYVRADHLTGTGTDADVAPYAVAGKAGLTADTVAAGGAAEQAAQALLAKYAVLIYPHPSIMTPETAAVLEAYVRDGGTLVLGCRTAFKDEHGHCVQALLPGLMRKVTGADVKEYTLVHPDDGKSVPVSWNGEDLDAAVFNEILGIAEDAGTSVAGQTDQGGKEVVTAGAEENTATAVKDRVEQFPRVEGRYTGSYYAGEPALIHNRYGKGETWYFGGAFSERTAKVFLENLGLVETFGDVISAPEEVDVVCRAGAAADGPERKEDPAEMPGAGNETGRKFYFVLNYDGAPQEIVLHKPLTDVDTGETVSGSVTLSGYGTKVYYC